MKQYILLLSATSLLSFSCSRNSDGKSINRPIIQNKDSMIHETTVTAKNSNEEVSCKLTSADLQKRKETVIASLKKQIIEKKELPNGYAYKFAGTDEIVDELAEFVKSERSCCSFFMFGLSFSGDGSEAWLNLTGPDGAKEMITDEIGL